MLQMIYNYLLSQLNINRSIRIVYRAIDKRDFARELTGITEV